MIREMIAEREIIEQSLSSTKENFSRIEADYKETRVQLKLKTDELLVAKQSITVSFRFKFAVFRGCLVIQIEYNFCNFVVLCNFKIPVRI